MSYSWLTYVAASAYLVLGLTMLYRLVTRLRRATFSEMTIQTKFGLVVFVVLLAYCATRSAYLYAQAAGAFSGSALDITTNFIAAIPATLFLVLQTTLLYKWNLHVSDVTEVLHQDRFRVGGTLIASSVGLSISCIIIAVAGACSINNGGIFNGTEWVILLSLFYGVSYSFNGWSFLGLGLYLRWLWTPNSPKAKKASYRILGIAVIFGLCCAFRGGIICYFVKPHIDGTSVSPDIRAASEYAQTIIYILECLCLSISLVYLTSTDGNNNNKQSSTCDHRSDLKEPLGGNPQYHDSSDGGGHESEYDETGRHRKSRLHHPDHTATVSINSSPNNKPSHRSSSSLAGPVNNSYLGTSHSSVVTMDTVRSHSSVLDDPSSLGAPPVVTRSKIASSYAARHNSSLDALHGGEGSPTSPSNYGGSSRRNQPYGPTGSYRENRDGNSQREGKRIGHITINNNGQGRTKSPSSTAATQNERPSP